MKAYSAPALTLSLERFILTLALTYTLSFSHDGFMTAITAFRRSAVVLPRQQRFALLCRQ